MRISRIRKWFVASAVLATQASGLPAAAGVSATTGLPQAPSVSTESRSWEGKVHPRALADTAAGQGEFLVYLVSQADLRGAAALRDKSARGRWVHRSLTRLAGRTQAPVLRLLEGLGAEHRSFWIANMIWVRGPRPVLEAVARRADVLRVDPNPGIQMEAPAPGAEGAAATAGVEWNLVQVGADMVWSQGFTGQGVVIGGQDTGYQWSHPALRDRYRGWDGAAADHAYNWHDAIHSGGGGGGAAAPAPCDDDLHGTHTMGTMVGDDGGVNRIGMAPGARWIGCRNMDQGFGTPATYAECFQWFVAPTDLAGNNPDPARAPDVINNSWACPPFEGCAADTLKTVVENTRAAGIVVVTSAGNEGSACESIFWPPAIYEASFSVGATDATDTIASFSSRGPVTVDGSGRLKPDVTAPGVGVRSSVPGGGYAAFSGTSMAGPHVAGQVALLLSARPDLRGQVDVIEAILRDSALKLGTNQVCGGIPANQVPNPVYGHGRVDAAAMLAGDADGDGTSNLADCAPADAGLWTVPDAARSLSLGGVAGEELSWSPPEGTGGAGPPVYDVLRAGSPADFGAAACVASGLAGTSLTDPALPVAGVLSYLIQARNACGANAGAGSSGTPRAGRACP